MPDSGNRRDKSPETLDFVAFSILARALHDRGGRMPSEEESCFDASLQQQP